MTIRTRYDIKKEKADTVIAILKDIPLSSWSRDESKEGCFSANIKDGDNDIEVTMSKNGQASIGYIRISEGITYRPLIDIVNSVDFYLSGLEMEEEIIKLKKIQASLQS